MEEDISGAGNFTVVHNRGAYPMVQLVQKDPSVLTQEYSYMINHTDNNQFTLMLQSGMSLTDGVIVAIW
jgi:hypothetical protein